MNTLEKSKHGYLEMWNMAPMEFAAEEAAIKESTELTL